MWQDVSLFIHFSIKLASGDQATTTKVQFPSFISAPLFPGWRATVDNTTFSSIFIKWTNLTRLLNRQVRHYIIILNRKDNDILANNVTSGNRLSAVFTGLRHLTSYTIEVFGVDKLGQPYKTLAVNATTKNSKIIVLNLFLLFSICGAFCLYLCFVLVHHFSWDALYEFPATWFS